MVLKEGVHILNSRFVFLKIVLVANILFLLLILYHFLFVTPSEKTLLFLLLLLAVLLLLLVIALLSAFLRLQAHFKAETAYYREEINKLKKE